MFSRRRVPRVRRSSLLLAVIVASLAFPLGVWANHQFADVPTGASYHDDVEALVNAGVTSGCGGGNYCPSNNVTRAQMAQFLNRLGNLDGNSTPSVDADTVDGHHAADLNVVAQGVVTDAVLTTTHQTIGTVTISTPGPGFVLVHGTTTAYSFDADCPCEITATLSDDGDGDTGPAWNNARVGVDPGTTDIATIAVSHVFEVDDAGPHTFYLTAKNWNYAEGVLANATFGSLLAQYTPYGSTNTVSATGDAATSGTRLSD